MEEISKEEVKKLIENKYLRNTSHGFVDDKYKVVGFYRTRHKRYIEDKYAELAKELS